MTYLIAVCNITEKFILSGNIDQVDLPGKVKEHREMAKKKDKVYKSCTIYMYRAEKGNKKHPCKKWIRKLWYMYIFTS